MFYYLNGTITHMEANLAVVDCGGVGYACHTTMKTLAALKMGEKAKLFTYCNIKEDAFDVFGFVSQTELNCFKLLISISGVGPKAALSILSSSAPEDLALAVASGNEKALTIAPGIGKKLAQRILLELKDKLGKELGDLSGSADWGPVMSGGDSGGKLADITAALTVLGYAPNEINAALKGVDLENLSVEDAIKLVLKKSLK
ncbi:MAG: Holliday junction branch migration protein RuvA [Oscillospiraceae bacterium]|nr:Holliday junction branch migration protein RuvA [Oscillospiraceae bacterium]